uniref:Uncharacterized protein n=1 Tax=viral metagenome TaxID=1070528 RepID=A0A6C0E032_9ZZZZ
MIRSRNRKKRSSLNRKSIKRSSLNRKSIKRSSLNRKSVKRSSLNRKSVYTKNDLDKLIGLRCIQKMTLKNGKSYVGTFGSKEYFSEHGGLFNKSSESGIYGIQTYNNQKYKLTLAKLEDIIKVSTCGFKDRKIK